MTLTISKIPYLTHGWPVVTGCSHGCDFCWARAMANRYNKGFDPMFRPEHLADPLRRKLPSVIGVSFLGDLFDPGIDDDQIAATFGVMAAAHTHTFIVLTKQADRMQGWFREAEKQPQGARRWCGGIAEGGVRDSHHGEVYRVWSDVGDWPLRHVWLGVSVSGPGDTHRILDLQRTPAVHRWVSYEPALDHLWFPMAGGAHDLPEVDAVIMGGESGPGWRPMDEDWARSMRDQCARRGIAFSLKQAAGLRPEHTPELDGVRHWNVPWMGGGA